ncbi:MAG: site-specific DNA-methyltransferase [Desulfosarcina sp.]|nr:site-specific DNA-methyltransferase [Desulfobacterales bacterium]
MNGKSLDLNQDKIEKLKGVIPEAFTEGLIDWEKLKAALGADIEFKNERYVLNWAGKSDAFRVLQSPTTATLATDRDESVNFDDTKNIFIEGENFEVLKVLQKSYFSKIKMIYIDPPYNTGNDNFIYPDRFSETREEYLVRIGDKDEAGYMTREGLFRKNSKDSGHYHSNWLSMMYPRLFLARNLLKDDGVIFISIDDNEVHNLRLLMNEVFGEENFIGTIIWKKKTNGNNMGNIPPVHDYIVAYGKQVSNEEMLYGFPLSDEYLKSTHSNPDDDPRGPWTISDLSANHKGPHFSITNFNTGKSYYPPKGRYWVFNEKEVERRIIDGRIIFGKTGDARPAQKIFLNERKSLRVKPESWWDKHGLNEDGTKELGKLFFPKIFVHSKPSKLIKHITNISTKNSDIILDFFSGSCTTAHSVLDLNKQDNSTRKFIMLQLPEKSNKKSEAYKAGYKTIADIGKERIRRVIKKIKESENGKLPFEKTKQDLGLKVFKLQASNFKIWRGDNIKDGKQIEKQMQLHLDPIKTNATEENMLFELLLKSGRSLNSAIESANDYYRINNGEMVIALSKIDEKVVDSILEDKPQIFITLDRLFKNNDQLKTNTLLQMKDAGIEFKVV